MWNEKCTEYNEILPEAISYEQISRMVSNFVPTHENTFDLGNDFLQCLVFLTFLSFCPGLVSNHEIW